MTNTSNPKTVYFGQLAGIDDITFILKLVIKFGEHEFPVLGHVEGDDRRRLQSIVQQRREAPGAHA